MSVDLDLPNPWTFNANFSGALDLDLDEIRIKELAPIELKVSQLPDFNFRVKELPVVRLESNSKLDVDLDSNSKLDVKLASTSRLDTSSKLESNSKLDLGLDNIRIRELPTLKFEFGVKPVRLHFPINYQWRLTVFGFELFKFNTCGESQIIAEDYVARSTESCS